MSSPSRLGNPGPVPNRTPPCFQHNWPIVLRLFPKDLFISPNKWHFEKDQQFNLLKTINDFRYSTNFPLGFWVCLDLSFGPQEPQDPSSSSWCHWWRAAAWPRPCRWCRGRRGPSASDSRFGQLFGKNPRGFHKKTWDFISVHPFFIILWVKQFIVVLEMVHFLLILNQKKTCTGRGCLRAWSDFSANIWTLCGVRPSSSRWVKLLQNYLYQAE